MNKTLITILLTGFVFTSCDFSDPPCMKTIKYQICTGTCDLNITGKGDMKGWPQHVKFNVDAPLAGFGVDIGLDRNDLAQECEENHLPGYYCTSVTIEVGGSGCIHQGVGTTCNKISNGYVGIYYVDLKLYDNLAKDKTVVPPEDEYKQYLVSQGQWTLLKADKEGVKETFSVTYTPNPKFVDFLKEYDLYMDYIRLDGSCSCKMTTGTRDVPINGPDCHS